MPAVALLIAAVAVGLVAVGLATLWPVVAGAVPATASGLAGSTVLFGGLLLVAAVVVRRVTPETAR